VETGSAQLDVQGLKCPKAWPWHELRSRGRSRTDALPQQRIPQRPPGLPIRRADQSPIDPRGIVAPPVELGRIAPGLSVQQPIGGAEGIHVINIPRAGHCYDMNIPDESDTGEVLEARITETGFVQQWVAEYRKRLGRTKN